jgi:hypothetical protein
MSDPAPLPATGGVWLRDPETGALVAAPAAPTETGSYIVTGPIDGPLTFTPVNPAPAPAPAPVKKGR